MESHRKYLFLSRSFHSDWFALLCVSTVHSFFIAEEDSIAAFFSEVVSLFRWCLAILCGREPGPWMFQDLPLWLPPRRTDFHSDPKSWNSWEGIWLTCCGSDTHPWTEGLWLSGQRHMKSMAKPWESSQCVWFQPSAHVGTSFWPGPTLQIHTKCGKCIILGSIPNASNIKCKEINPKGKFLYKFSVKKTFLTMIQNLEVIK